jgi:hypothetical protein
MLFVNISTAGPHVTIISCLFANVGVGNSKNSSSKGVKRNKIVSDLDLSKLNVGGVVYLFVVGDETSASSFIHVISISNLSFNDCYLFTSGSEVIVVKFIFISDYNLTTFISRSQISLLDPLSTGFSVIPYPTEPSFPIPPVKAAYHEFYSFIIQY